MVFRSGVIGVVLCIALCIASMLCSCVSMPMKSVDCGQYGVRFSIPANYEIVESSMNYKSAEPAEFADLIDHWTCRFSDNGYVTVSKLDDYRMSTVKDTLERTYAEKKIGKGEYAYLPYLYRDGGYNCTVFAVSDVEYIESEDGRYRGMAYFAEIAQDEFPCVSCVMVMTDGNNVFEFVSRRFTSGKYRAKIKNGEIRDFDQNEYSGYLRTIRKAASEEVIRKYEREFSLIMMSVGSDPVYKDVYE